MLHTSDIITRNSSEKNTEPTSKIIYIFSLLMKNFLISDAELVFTSYEN